MTHSTGILSILRFCDLENIFTAFCSNLHGFNVVVWRLSY